MMKKYIWVILCVFLYIMLFGCTTESATELDNASSAREKDDVVWHVAFLSDESGSVRALSSEDAIVLSDILASDSWAPSLSNYAVDVTLKSENEEIFRYNAKHGIFDDAENNRSLVLDEKKKESMNDMLGKYGILDFFPEDIPAPESYEVSAQYIRTNIKQGGNHPESQFSKFPYVHLVRSKEELDAYYKEYQECFDLERKYSVFADETIGFLDACEKYDEAYFQEHTIVLVVLSEPASGSIRHKITDVRQNRAGEWVIYIDRLLPKERTDDEAAWHIFVEIQMGNVIRPEDTIVVNMNDVRVIELPGETEPILLSVTSNADTIIPYKHFAYSCEWTGDGLLYADGMSLQCALSELEKHGVIPELYYNDDFSASYTENVSFSHILLYDENLDPPDTRYDISELAQLDEGIYYVGIVINQQGKFIEEAGKYEYTGWACVFKLHK